MAKRGTILLVLVISQLVFLSLPNELIVPFNRLVRPTLYASIAVVCFIYAGRQERPRPNAGLALILSVIGGILYFSAVFITGFIAGFGRNVMFGSPMVIVENLWVYATVAFFSEYIRTKIIKGGLAITTTVVTTTVITTLVYTFVQLDTLRNIFGADMTGLLDFFFAVAFPVLLMNVVLSYMALDAGLPALLVVRIIFGLSTVFLPVLPNCSQAVFAAMTGGVLFAFIIFYHYNIRSKRSRSKARRKRLAKKRPVLLCALPIVLLALIISFGLRLFPYYPVAVLTGSMTGTIDAGSLVFVRKMKASEVYGTVEQGDILHYRARNIEIIHRVIDFRYDANGELVYVTKGDANPYADMNPVEAGQVLGITKAYIPYLGYPFLVIRALFI